MNVIAYSRFGTRALQLALALGLAALLAPAAAGAQTVPKADALQGDGRISDFYTWQNSIPHKAGTLLRTEPLPETLSLPDAARAQRILYSSTSGIDGATPVVVSGDMFVPKGIPPAGGWPVIAWAHGTVGVADICAPSWAARSYRDSAYLDTWLAQGYAVVATDYEGLGTPGGHPYLNVRSEAYSVLDSVRAARVAVPTLANDVVIVGQSQGGGAAFGTAGWAPAYAADINVRGTVATGVPYFAPNVPSAGLSDPTAVDPGIAYIFYLVVMAQQSDPSIDPASVFQTAALPLFEVSRSSCIYSLEQDVELARLTDATSLKPALTALLVKHYPEFEYRTLALPQPVFIGTGTADHDVRPATQERLVKDSCAAGTLVQAHLYAGLTHSETVNASLKDSLPFVRAVFAGEKPVPNCSPTPQ